MKLWQKIIAVISAVISLISAIWLYSMGHRQGKMAGEKQAYKEVQRAEKLRQAKQQQINEIQQETNQKIQTVNDTNSVDEFNRMFNEPSPPPPRESATTSTKTKNSSNRQR